MRVKPSPGTYRLHLAGYDYIVTITTDGMIFHHFPFEYAWRWEEIAGGPILIADNALAAPFIVGFEEPDVVTVRTPKGTVKGTYEKIP